MAVTDLTDTLPWWVTGAQPQSGQPTPPGARGGAGTSWLEYLASMFNPVGQAQAAETDPRTAALKAALAAQQGGASQTQPPDLPIPAGSGAVGGPAATPQGGGGYGGMPPSAWGGPAPYVGSGAMAFPRNPPAASPAAPPVAAAPSAANPLASAGAAVTGSPASANPSRFVQVDRPNASPVGAMGRGGPPQMTALNLSGLFGRAPQGNMGGNPANVPAPNAQPVSGVLAKPTRSSAPWWMGPFQQGVFGPGAADLERQKARSGYQ